MWNHWSLLQRIFCWNTTGKRKHQSLGAQTRMPVSQTAWIRHWSLKFILTGQEVPSSNGNRIITKFRLFEIKISKAIHQIMQSWKRNMSLEKKLQMITPVSIYSWIKWKIYLKKNLKQWIGCPLNKDLINVWITNNQWPYYLYEVLVKLPESSLPTLYLLLVLLCVIKSLQN